MIIDGDGTEDQTKAGGPDASQNGTHQETDETQSQPGEDTNLDGGATDQEVGELGSGNESQTGEEEGAVTTDPVQEIVAVRAQMEALSKKLETLNQPKHPEAPRELSENEWKAKEAEWGVPRSTIQAVTAQSAYLYQRLMTDIMSEFDKRMGGFEKSNALQGLAKDPRFSDAPKYQKDVDEFLKDFDSKHHSNPELLKRAVIYARGLNIGKTINKVRNEGERNRTISGVARPASPNGGIRAKSAPLNAIQRQAAELVGGEGEYRKFMRNGTRGAVVIEK